MTSLGLDSICLNCTKSYNQCVKCSFVTGKKDEHPVTIIAEISKQQQYKRTGGTSGNNSGQNRTKKNNISQFHQNFTHAFFV